MSVTINVSDFTVEIAYKELLKPFAEMVVEELKRSAPKNTGAYEQGFTYKIENINNIWKIFIYNDGKNKTLSHILEFGTTGKGGQSPQPHFRIVFEQNEKKFIEEMKKAKIKQK